MKTDVRRHIALVAAQIEESGTAIMDSAFRIRQALGDDPAFLIVGCGDSLAAAELAISAGQGARSAGDIAWGGALPRSGQAVVALSVSGTTDATVTAAQLAKEACAPVIAVTAGATSPLASTADYLITIPQPPACDSVPAGGFLTMGLAIAGLLGRASESTATALVERLETLVEGRAGKLLAPTATLPAAISVCSLPELQAARRFWTLKFIEAAGLAARSVPLEEWGHVDYFIGAQPHLDLVLLGGHGRNRAAALRETMARVGHDHFILDAVSDFGPVPGSDEASAVLTNLVVGAAGALFADACARAWDRVPFRGGAVDMSAAHIQSPSMATS